MTVFLFNEKLLYTLDEIGSKHVNHLANAKSPYLLQPVHNPIDWYSWGEEAFAKAREADKPIFFSCGYSMCHWCHIHYSNIFL
ncbi:DUF255 domain-containing protein [Sporomusa sp. KB1]|jgi:uncharacterized protein YyaL (SSP411 family)|uniref:DUF255 domain-containing protein n=1 Tax=Sporomusa sp. KB1 TaxID=943346 RepID=UPI0011A8CB8E|nr:DUF255 domain-containing protein [Sporomusa sp. KB1]